MKGMVPQARHRAVRKPIRIKIMRIFFDFFIPTASSMAMFRTPIFIYRA